MEEQIKETGKYLRTTILEMPKMAEISKVDDLYEYHLEPPDRLLLLLRQIICGKSDIQSEAQERRIMSVAEDVISCTSKGSVKPQKHILMGLGIKSMTGSKKIVKALNRFGHSIDYCTIKNMKLNLQRI